MDRTNRGDADISSGNLPCSFIQMATSPRTRSAALAAAWRLTLLAICVRFAGGQEFFPINDVRAGLHGVGRTVFQGDVIEEFQVEILGVLKNLSPKQTIILARLSGGPLRETGVLQGMSGSPVYIDGKLLGAIALGFPFSKEPIAGIQPIESMLADATFAPSQGQLLNKPGVLNGNAPSPFGNLSDIPIPLALSGFSSSTLASFSPSLRNLGFQPQEGVSAAAPHSQQRLEESGRLKPGSMISVGLITGDMNMTADGTVTYINGSKIYAFGHRFLDTGATELPFARAEVIASIPTLNSSFKLSAPQEWEGTILSDRSSAIAGEIGRPSHTVPLIISVRSPATGSHEYRLQVVNDRLLTPLLTQTALFSTIDATERALGAGTLRLQGRVEFEGNLPPLIIHDLFVSDSGVAQQVSADAVVALGFVLGGGFQNLRMRSMSFSLDQLDSKRQVRLAQAWTSPREARPGDAVQITALLQGENGLELTRTATYHVPIGAPLGMLNFTVSDAITQNFPDFAGLSQSVLQTPERLIAAINSYRSSDAVYVRVWRQEPSFTVAGPLPGGELTDPPPSVMLILADPSSSAYSNPAATLTRGSEVAQLVMPVDDYVVTGSKTVQVEVKE